MKDDFRFQFLRLTSPWLLRSIVVFLSVLVSIGGCRSKSSDESQSINTFGHRQLDQMLEDRPDMQSLLSDSDPILRWVIDGFDGDRHGHRIYWIARTPHSGRSAEHASAYEGYPACIAISGGSETTPVDKWASVVYEMFNMENSQGFEDAYHDALKGKIDGDTYALRCVKLEFLALEKTRDFFHQNPLPKSKHGRDVWYNWVIKDLPTFEQYKASFDVPGTTVATDNFKYFKEYYDTTLLPYARQTRNTGFLGSVQHMLNSLLPPNTDSTDE